jgi:uncharacterized protein (DUF58 family)
MARRARAEVELPSPGVRFAPDYRARLGQLCARLAAARERREGAGRAQLFGTGSEFVGYRPYRSGEDLRALDWNLFARLGRPYVRVSAREASEEWAVVLDTSASMGVGHPGKLQLAAEFAGALAALGVARRATVELWTPGAELRAVVRKRAALEAWFATLEGLRAAGQAGLARAVDELARRRGAGRVFLVGDFLDLPDGGLARLARPSRELVLAQVLAREELVPPAAGSVRWVDAESGRARTLALDAVHVASYERRLVQRLARLRAEAARRRARLGTWTSDTPFETLVTELCA